MICPFFMLPVLLLPFLGAARNAAIGLEVDEDALISVAMPAQQIKRYERCLIDGYNSG
jgi:hypothetical protein